MTSKSETKVWQFNCADEPDEIGPRGKPDYEVLLNS